MMLMLERRLIQKSSLSQQQSCHSPLVYWVPPTRCLSSSNPQTADSLYGDPTTRESKDLKSRLLLSRKNWSKILALHFRRGHSFTPDHYSIAWNRLQYCNMKNFAHARFQVLLNDTVNKISDPDGFRGMGGANFARILIAMMNLGLDSRTNDPIHSMLTASCGNDELAQWFVQNADHKDIAFTVAALAHLKFRATPLLRALDEYVGQTEEKINHKVLSECLHGSVAMGYNSPNVARKLVDQSKEVFEFDIVDYKGIRTYKFLDYYCISRAAWALAKMGFPCEPFFKVMETKNKWIWNEANTDEVSDILWACGEVGCKNLRLFQSVNEQTDYLFGEEEPSPTAIAKTVVGYAKNEMTWATNIIEQIDIHSDRIAKEGTPSEIADCAWALEIFNHDAGHFFNDVDKDAERFVKDTTTTADHIAKFLRTSGVLSGEVPVPTHVWGHLEDRIVWYFDTATPKMIANSIWAMARTGARTSEFTRLFGERSKDLLEKWDDNDTAKVRWACYDLRVPLPPAVSEALRLPPSKVEKQAAEG